MRKRMSKLLSILLTLVMMVGLVPATAYADESGDDCYIMIGSTMIDDLDVAASGSGWEYTPGGTPTITLNNYKGGKIQLYDPTPEDGIYSTVKLRIDVKGDCEINNNSGYGISLETDNTTFNQGEGRGVQSALYIYFSNNASLTINSPRGIGNVSFNPVTYIQGSANLNINATNIGIMACGSLVKESSGAGTIDKLYGGDIYIDNGLILDVKAPTPFTNGPASPSKLIVDNGAMVLMTSTTDEDFINELPYYLYSIPDDYTAYKNAKESILQLYKLTVVSKVGVKDITVPVVGEKPDYSAATCGNGYEIKDIDWSYYDETISNEELRWVLMNSGDTFKPGEKYLCTVEVVPSWNATFPDAKADLSAEFNDENANISPVYDANKAYVEKEFTVPHVYIDQPDNVSVNVNKKAPVSFTFSGGATFGCVEYYKESENRWIDLHTFTLNTDVEANKAVAIEIPAKDTAQTLNCRIKLQATSDSKIYISDEFTVEWENKAVEPIEITEIVINDVDAPVENGNVTEAPSFKLPDGANYVVESAQWMHGSNDLAVSSFIEGNDYRAVFKVVPKEGYKFASAPTMTINGENAGVRFNNDTAASIFIKLTAVAEGGDVTPELIEITEIVINGVDAPVENGDVTVAPSFKLPDGANYVVESAQWMHGNNDLAVSSFIEGNDYRAVFKVVPKEGYKFASAPTMTINGENAGVRFNNDTAASIFIKLTAVADGGTTPEDPAVTGITIDPVSVEVVKGNTQQFTASVSGTGDFSNEVVWAVSGGTTSTINANGLLTVGAGETAETLTVTVKSAADNTKTATARVTVKEPASTEYTITATAGENGTITPSGKVAVEEGENQTFTITANDGYHIKDVKVNGVSVDAVSTYTFEDVAANATIVAEFEKNTVVVVNHSVKFDYNDGSDPTTILVEHNDVVSEPAEPTREGFIFKGWFLEDGNEYDFTKAVTGDFTLTAKWEESSGDDVVEPSVTLNKENLSLVVSGTEQLIATVEVPEGMAYALSWASDDDTVAKVDEDGNVTAVAVGTATITVTLMPGAVPTAEDEVGYPTASCVVTVTEKAPTPTPTPSKGGGGSTKYKVTLEDTDNGTVESSRTKASKGTTVTITVDPEAGYEVDDIVVETKAGKEVEVTDKGEGKFTFKMPAADVTVSVDFAKADAEDSDAKEEVEYIQLTIDSVIAWVFDEFVANDVAPVIRNARTMLPARFVAEALGGVVTWNEEAQKVTIVNGEDTIEIFIGEPFATVNGNPVELDSPAFIENSRTYLPIRFIAENMGATVTWDAAERTVTIVPGE